MRSDKWALQRTLYIELERARTSRETVSRKGWAIVKIVTTSEYFM